MQILQRLRRISYDRLSDTAESFDDLFIAYESLNAENGDDKENIVSVGLYLLRRARYECQVHLVDLFEELIIV